MWLAVPLPCGKRDLLTADCEASFFGRLVVVKGTSEARRGRR
jgi:hypothetical protein